ncbi:MAG: TonB-dependent receptor [Janthinobacterium lividum]
MPMRPRPGAALLRRRCLLCGVLLHPLAWGLLCTPAAYAADAVPAAGAPPPDQAAPPAAGPAVGLGTGEDAPPPVRIDVPEVAVTARRLDAARSAIQPGLGATTYEFGRRAIESIPQGDNAQLSQVLLQAPGVAQDSFGQLHVRGDHNEVQYRLDGVQLPEGLSVFGQALEGRFAHSLSLITGALPAQYGFLTAGVVDITTKSGTTDPGGTLSIYGGARDTLQPSFAYGGRSGAIDFFATGDFLHTRVGIENPTGSFNAVHDLSNQQHGLAHISGLIDPDTRVSLIAGFSNDFFQVPNNPGQTPSLGLSVDGASTFDSARLTQHQREITDFAILSLQHHAGPLDVQTSAFSRTSSLYYSPDPVGDLLFNGVAQTAARSVWSSGAQTDASLRVDGQHTLRAGFQVFAERNIDSTDSTVLPAPGGGGTDAASFSAFAIHGGQGTTGLIYGLYLQDEWRILPRVTLNAGLRFDRVDEFTHEGQVSPRVNAVWRPTDTTTVHAGYARYFVPPPFESVGGAAVAAFSGTSTAAEVTQDSTVRAERDNYYDLGIDQVLARGLRVGLDAYYKDARDLIDEGQFGAPIILTAFNYARGQVHGVEASGSYDRGPVSLYANAALSRAIGRDIVSSQFNFSADDLAYISHRWIHLDHDQRWTGSAGAAWTVFGRSTSPARLSADLVVGSGLRADGDVPNGRALPGYATVNLSAVQTLDVGFGRGTQLRLDVINLLDSRYEIRDGTGVGVGAPQYGLRRTILGGLLQRF